VQRHYNGLVELFTRTPGDEKTVLAVGCLNVLGAVEISSDDFETATVRALPFNPHTRQTSTAWQQIGIVMIPQGMLNYLTEEKTGFSEINPAVLDLDTQTLDTTLKLYRENPTCSFETYLKISALI